MKQSCVLLSRIGVHFYCPFLGEGQEVAEAAKPVVCAVFFSVPFLHLQPTKSERGPAFCVPSSLKTQMERLEKQLEV